MAPAVDLHQTRAGTLRFTALPGFTERCSRASPAARHQNRESYRAGQCSFPLTPPCNAMGPHDATKSLLRPSTRAWLDAHTPLKSHVKKVWQRSQSSLIHKSTSASSEEEIERFIFHPSLWPFRSVSSFCSFYILYIHFYCEYMFVML